MKKAILMAGIVLAALAVLSDSGTNAVNLTFADKVSMQGDTKTKGETGTYGFDKSHSFIGFKVKHMGLINVSGFFRDFTGQINYNAEDVTKSSVNFAAKVASVQTGAAGRDRHLQQADFFDAQKFPEITFKSTKVEKRGDDLYLTGDLTIRDVTKRITFEFDIEGFLPARGNRSMTVGVSADTKIKRFDYGVNNGIDLPAGTPGVANEVDIELEIEAIKQKEAEQKPAQAN